MSRLRQILQSFEETSRSPCLEGHGFSYSYGDLAAEVRQWNSRFEAMKLQAGSVVALRADYSLSSVAALLALCAGQAIPALIPRDRPVEEYLADTEALLLLDVSDDGKCRYRSMAARRSAHPLIAQLRTAGEAGVIIFTSGSTGRPKAALHNLERFLQKFDRPGRSLRTLAFLLFDHVAGLDTVLYTLRNSGALILTRARDPGSILRLIASHRVEVLPTSPSFLRLLCALPDIASFDLTSLKIITYGSEPMDGDTLRRVNACFPNAQIIQKYGTTETGSPRTASRSKHSLWLRFKDNAIQTKIVDGVLWLRGGGTMLGYLNAPSPVTDDGWYCTGDLVEVDGEWVRFAGRSDQIIKVGGEKVAPIEVETVIRELDFVRGAFVTGEPHPLMGSVVTARVVVSRTTCDPKNAATHIRSHCRKRLHPHKVPLRIEVVLEDALTVVGYRQKTQPGSLQSAMDRKDVQEG